MSKNNIRIVSSRNVVKGKVVKLFFYIQTRSLQLSMGDIIYFSLSTSLQKTDKEAVKERPGRRGRHKVLNEFYTEFFNGIQSCGEKSSLYYSLQI